MEIGSISVMDWVNLKKNVYLIVQILRKLTIKKKGSGMQWRKIIIFSSKTKGGVMILLIIRTVIIKLTKGIYKNKSRKIGEL